MPNNDLDIPFGWFLTAFTKLKGEDLGDVNKFENGIYFGRNWQVKTTTFQSWVENSTPFQTIRRFDFFSRYVALAIHLNIHI
jgi:hypothetical protein